MHPWSPIKRIVYQIFNPPEHFRKLLRCPENIYYIKWHLITLKRFLDTGFTQTAYLKYAVMLFGLSSLNVEKTLFFGLIYLIFCVFFGYVYFLFQFAELETEWSNRFNYFVSEMRNMKDKLEKNL